MADITEKENIYITKQCVDRDICDANVHYALLFDWVNGILVNEAFYRNFEGMFFHVRDAIETKYILALSKLFGSFNEAGLWKLIIQTKDVPEEIFENRLLRDPEFVREDMRREREKFFNNFDNYIRKIQAIEDKINPLRNIQKAHNLPWRPNGTSVTWEDTKGWLTFAEEVYVNAMNAICEGSATVGEFIPEELRAQMKYFARIVNKTDWVKME